MQYLLLWNVQLCRMQTAVEVLEQDDVLLQDLYIRAVQRGLHPQVQLDLLLMHQAYLLVLFCSGLESESKFDDTESIKILASE